MNCIYQVPSSCSMLLGELHSFILLHGYFSKKTASVFLQVLSSIYLNCKMFIIKAIVTKKTIKPFFIFEGDHYFSMLNARSVMKATYHYFYVDQCGLNKTFLCGPILFYPHFGHFNIGKFFHSTSAFASMTKSVSLHVCHYQPPSSL